MTGHLQIDEPGNQQGDADQHPEHTGHDAIEEQPVFPESILDGQGLAHDRRIPCLPPRMTSSKSGQANAPVKAGSQ